MYYTALTLPRWDLRSTSVGAEQTSPGRLAPHTPSCQVATRAHLTHRSRLTKRMLLRINIYGKVD